MRGKTVTVEMQPCQFAPVAISLLKFQPITFSQTTAEIMQLQPAHHWRGRQNEDKVQVFGFK